MKIEDVTAPRTFEITLTQAEVGAIIAGLRCAEVRMRNLGFSEVFGYSRSDIQKVLRDLNNGTH